MHKILACITIIHNITEFFKVKMKKRIIFEGVGTALVTPFRGGHIDYAAFELLVERQISAGVDALIIGGTTGEAATLSDRERYALYTRAVDLVGGRVPVILGAGTNDTRVAIKHARAAERLCADGILVVTPYYNKGTSAGLVEHYKRIAHSVDTPIILYNVPSRTGVNIGIGELSQLSEIENVVGIKEAADSSDRLVRIASLGESLPLYAGNDSQTYTVMALGGKGVISVVSNVYPSRMQRITDEYLAGRPLEALASQASVLPLIDAMFIETNPAPVKYALSRLGLCREEMRLPMKEVGDKSREAIDRALKI